MPQNAEKLNDKYFLKKFFVKIGFILKFFHNFATPKH